MEKMIKCILLGLIVCLQFNPLPAGARSTLEKSKRLIQSGNYKEAYNRLIDRPSSAENYFLRGYARLKSQNYTRASDYFRQVIENYPDSNRATDARYFVDRLRLYLPVERRVPEIRVLLVETTDLDLVFNNEVVLETAGKKISVSAEDLCTAEIVSGKVKITTARGKSLTGSSIKIAAPEGHLNYQKNVYRGKFILLPVDEQVLLINVLPLDKYLYGVIEKEIAPGWPLETVKAQAVAARSFALYYLRQNKDEPYDLGKTWLAQVYGGKNAETDQVLKAVRQTGGEVLVHRGKAVPGYFHANSGGYIEAGEKIWGNSTDFIGSRKDTWSLEAQHAYWENTVSLGKINEKLAAEGFAKIGRVESLEIASRLPSGRSLELTYRSENGNLVTIRSDKFRLAVGPEKIRSTWIEELDFSSDSIRFVGRGWGHGVGMSQWGAYRMGEEGRNYREILKFYYNNAEIMGNYGFM
ncbi:MAG: SpoIID/LytB domain-containing protein [bacterium]